MASRRWWVGWLLGLMLVGCGSGGGGAPGPAASGPVARLVLTPETLTVAAGSATQVTVQGRTADDRPVAVTGAWAVDPAVGTIDAAGLFTATTTTSTASPAAGALTVTASGLTAQAPVTVIPGALARLTVAQTAAVDLSTLAPGDVVSFTAVGEDEYGNRGQSHRFPVTATWTVEGDVGVIDAAGQFVALSDGPGRVVATFGEQRSHLDLAVVLPAGVVEATGAVLMPGEDAELSTAAGYAIRAAGADVSIPMPVILEIQQVTETVIETPGDEGTVEPLAAQVRTPLHPFTQPLTVVVPRTTPPAGTTVAPVLDYGAWQVVPPPSTVTETAGTWEVVLEPLAQADGQSRAPNWIAPPKIKKYAALLHSYEYQLAPMASWHASGRVDFAEGYGTRGQRGPRWPRQGRVALVVHGIMSEPGIFFAKDATDTEFTSFLDDGLGYDEVWGFHYDTRNQVAVNAARLSSLLNAAMEDGQTVDVFAHSMGGLVTRYAIDELGQGRHISRLVTFGTPHLGSPWTKADEAVNALFSTANILEQVRNGGRGFSDSLEDMQPGSAFLTRLNAPPTGARAGTVYFAIAGNLNFTGGELPSSSSPEFAWLERSLERLDDSDPFLAGQCENTLSNGDGVVAVSSAWQTEQVITFGSMDRGPILVGGTGSGPDIASGLDAEGGLYSPGVTPLNAYLWQVGDTHHIGAGPLRSYFESATVRDQLKAWWRAQTGPITVQ